MSGNRYRLKSYSVYAVFLLCFAGLYARLYVLQIVNHRDLSTRGEQLHRFNVKIQPRRGTILDREGRPLAMSVSVKSAYAVPEVIESPAETAALIGGALEIPPAEILEKLNRKSRKFVWLARKLDGRAAERLEALGLEGVGFREEVRRVYPQGALLSHVLGFVDIDNRGLEGLERHADATLRGQAGWMASYRDRKGREIMTLRRRDVQPIDGADLTLTLDVVIQHIVESELENGCRTFNAQAGCIIVMNPQTGAVLAMSSWPTYDPNRPAEYPPEARRNRCITDVFEPGSTFKVITVATALDRGVVAIDDKFFCENGAFRVGRHTLHDVHAYGTLTTAEIVKKSSNIGAVKIAMVLGEEQLYEGIRQFGFGSPTGIGLPGEVAGILHPLSTWSGLSIAAVPMGQEIGVTPLQLASAVAAIANGGLAMKPYLVDSVRDSSGRVVKTFAPEVRGRVVREAAAKLLSEAMEGVPTREGTAPKAALAEYTVAGKTGTSQKVEPTGRYSHSRFIGSFIGFAPSRNPEVLVLVVLDEPRPVYYGGSVAGLILKEVSGRVLKYLGVPPDKETDGKIEVAMGRPR